MLGSLRITSLIRLRRLPLVECSLATLAPPGSLPTILSQKTRSCTHHRRREVERTGQSVTFSAAKVPLRIKAARTRQELIRHESAGEC